MAGISEGTYKMKLSEQARALSEGQHEFARDAILWLSWFQVRLDRVGTAWAARSKRARELRELYRFSDRELWDVGLSRSDLPAIADGTYRRD
jgi:uncharacterized protein YjiS (DUF1127 family)